MGRNRSGLVAALTVAALGLGAASAQADAVRVRSTTDIVDSGLKDDVIVPMYTAANPGDTIDLSSEGTGAAIASAEQGKGDALVTHAPATEAQFVNLGYSLEPLGRQIFYSDYVLVGPKDDPAEVSLKAPHDAITAFELIAAAGADGHATYVTRNDTSGTNVQEQLMWGLTSTVTTQTPINYTAPATPPAGAKEPGSGGTLPSWYVPAGTGKVGQGQGLTFANACVASSSPNGSCYTMADRGTFNRYVNQGLVPNLKIVSEHNESAARGGLNLLLNPFSVYVVNPAKFDPGVVNAAAGTRFADFMTSPAFQARLASYPSAADPAFTSDAFPTVTGAPATTASAGSQVPLTLTVADALPPKLPVAGIPVQLQASTDGGTTFTDVGSPVTTDNTGAAAFAPTISATTTYRATTPRFTKYSPAATVLGVVSVPAATPAPTPAATPGPTPAPTPAPDKTAPKVGKAALATKSLTISVNEKSTVKVVIAKKTTKTTTVKGKKKTKTTYTTAKRLTLSIPGSGSIKGTFKALKTGTYRVTITVTDASGNTRKQTVTLVLKAKKTTTKSLG